MEYSKILIVDDEKYIRHMLIDILSNLNMTCEAAENGVQALHMCIEQRYDFIVSDWHMPEMNGGYFVRLVRDLSGYQSTPILIFTSDEKIRESNKDLGEYPELDWVCKSLEPSHLIEYLCKRIFHDEWVDPYHSVMLHLS